jgi:uracil-DNA glycosylase
VLTVRDCQPNSHARRGWEHFTDAAIRTVSQQQSGVVFVLWGNAAQEKMMLINTNVHHILKAAHPSGLSANRGFFGCRHFTKTNWMLEKAGYLPINNSRCIQDPDCHSSKSGSLLTEHIETSACQPIFIW